MEGVKPIESTIRSSEKSNSPCRLKCAQVATEPLRMALISARLVVPVFLFNHKSAQGIWGFKFNLSLGVWLIGYDSMLRFVWGIIVPTVFLLDTGTLD